MSVRALVWKCFACALVLGAPTALAADNISVPAPPPVLEGEEPVVEGTPPSAATHLPSYEAPAIGSEELVVTGHKLLREEERIGDYSQPRWSAARRFPTTRIYVLPEGTFQFEWWNDWKFDLTGDEDPLLRWEYEVEMGLGHRLQLDLYIGTERSGWDGPTELAKEKVELRYAFADWGVLWGNPTIYLEFAIPNGGAPAFEGKLLLGGVITHRWYGATNLVFEGELGGERVNEYAVTAAASYAVVDQKFSIGAEVKGETADIPDARFAFNELNLLVGPSIQWRPVPQMHLDLVGLVGPTYGPAEAPQPESGWAAEPILVAGWEF